MNNTRAILAVLATLSGLAVGYAVVHGVRTRFGGRAAHSSAQQRHGVIVAGPDARPGG